MKRLRSTLTLLLSMLLSINLMTEHTHALEEKNDKQIEEAIVFINERGFPLGTIQNTEQENDRIIIRVTLVNDLITEYSYAKLTNNDVRISIKEANTINEILFKANGEVYVDGYLDLDLMGSGQSTINEIKGYASAYFGTIPSGWGNIVFSGPVSSSGYVNLGNTIVNCTIAYVATKICLKLIGTSTWTDIFTNVASGIITAAAAQSLGVSSFFYTATKYSNTVSAPTVSYYKYDAYYYVGSSTPSNTYYEQKILV
ncbi:MAG: hypothetical protein IKE06_04065 [Solobacterium sp.]|nr:hypothetical protein [Solobacterium sp.]